MQKPTNFYDLLKLQKILDETVGEERENGFIPRERKVIDVLLSLDDEFQEWLKELPDEYNFKTWKEKEYSREKEIIEFVDILFFYLQLVNFFKNIGMSSIDSMSSSVFESNFEVYPDNLISNIDEFKCRLWGGDYIGAFEIYMRLANDRKITKEIILEEYLDKWQKNMKRIKGDWSLQ